MKDGVRAAAVLAGILVLAGCVAPVVHERPTKPAPPPAVRVQPAAQPPRSLAMLIAQAPKLSQFRALATAGGLEALLMGRGAVTIIAPTDAAVARLPAGTVEALLQRGNRPSLLHLLRFWVGLTTLPPDDSIPVHIPTLDGEAVTVVPGTGTIMLVDAVGRRGYVVKRTSATDGALVELNGILAPRSIEPGGGR